MVSEKLSEVLDAKDPIKENYLLEVSSPGLDRVLKKKKISFATMDVMWISNCLNLLMVKSNTQDLCKAIL